MPSPYPVFGGQTDEENNKSAIRVIRELTESGKQINPFDDFKEADPKPRQVTDSLFSHSSRFL